MTVFKNKVLLTVAAATVFAAAFTTAEASRSRPAAPAPSPMDNYLGSWAKKAIDLQEKLQRNVPLKRSTFIYSHNSYNSKAYGSAFSYWVDPNHDYSIKDQLRMGVRALELDVHWYFAMHGWPWEWGNRPLLCHGQNNHVGCSSTDRDLNDGLQEIRDYIGANRDKVIVIYFENHWGSSYGSVLDRIKSKLGDYVYRTGSTTCQNYSLDITRQQVLNAGKNIILSADGGCQNGEWASYVYKFSWSSGSGKNQDFRAYPACQSGQSQATINDRFMRYWEDGTNLGNWFGGGSDKQTSSSIRNMLSCGVNMPGMDHIKPDDGRLEAHVWSWSPSEPNDYAGNEDCAEMWGNDGRWNDNNCGAVRPYACRTGYGSWTITGNGAWTGGASACAAIGASFDVPRDGYDNNRLLDVKRSRGVGSLWVNFSDRSSEGNWQ